MITIKSHLGMASLLDKVDSIKATSYTAATESDILNQIAIGEISLYGHRADIDMWCPFDYTQQKSIVVKRVVPMGKPIGIDGVNYYDSYMVECSTSGNEQPIIRVSENMTIDLLNGKFSFEANGNLESLLKDVKFIDAVKRGTSFYVGNKEITQINNVKIPKNLRNEMQNIKDLSCAFAEIGFVCNKKFSDFTEDNRHYIIPQPSAAIKLKNTKIETTLFVDARAIIHIYGI